MQGKPLFSKRDISDKVIFSWCHFLNKWFKMIFIYHYGTISSPFLNKKHI